jgi:hypothetical protein
MVVCSSCGREVQRRARQQRFCSARCKESARRRVRRAPKITHVRAKLPTNPPKISNGINGGQIAKIIASPDVLEVEVWGGRDWQPAVSSGGVAIEIGRLRARVLLS